MNKQNINGLKGTKNNFKVAKWEGVWKMSEKGEELRSTLLVVTEWS